MQPLSPLPASRAVSPLQRFTQWVSALFEPLRTWLERRANPPGPQGPVNLPPMLSADPEIWERPTQPVRRTTAPAAPPRLQAGESGRRYLIASHQATGGFGKYRYAVDENNKTWAAREVPNSATAKEIELLRRFNGRLQVHDEIKGEAKRWAILTLFGGELVDAFARIKEDSTRKALARHAVSQLATDLLRCHAQSFVHRDVKIASALWNADGSIALCDYSQALPKEANGTVTGPATTMGYAAPEMLLGGKYTEKVDVWSLAMAYTAMHDNRLQRLFALAHRNQEIIVTYLRWRNELLSRKGPLVQRLTQHQDRWDEYFLALAKADPEMCQFIIERMLDPRGVSRAGMDEVQTFMRRLQPPGCAAEREVLRALGNLSDADSKREAALAALKVQMTAALTASTAQ